MTIATGPQVSSTPSLHEDDHEQVVIRQDPETGLRFIVAVHSTALGPSLGGMRLRRYPGGLREALDDVLALSRTMTLKASAAGLELGGGKSVMLDDVRPEMRERRMVAAAGVIDSLGGAYVTAEDIGTTMSDMDLMAEHTSFVVGRSPERGGGGDPSPVTAETVFEAIGRGLLHATGSDELEGRRVGVIGVGKVGSALAARLVRAGARVVVCDIDAERAERFAVEQGAELAPSAESVLGLELDVLSPCAAGGLIDEPLARSIQCKVLAGAANNPLTGRAAARALAARGVLYVPDFLANCGGLIHVAHEWYGDRGPAPAESISRAMENLEAAIATAEAEDLTPHEVAERQALERVERARPSA